jgi:GTPase
MNINLDNIDVENYVLDTKCGFVAIVGRPNVGKSTLMNHVLGQKISITSRKPQTTRHQVMGIHTVDKTQLIFVDTPGIHSGGERAINQVMNKSATSVLRDVDVVLFVVDALKWTSEDARVLEMVKTVKAPVILVINKVDQIDDKEALLPHLEHLSSLADFKHVFPVSALRGHNLDELVEVAGELLPKNIFYFAEDQITNRNERFLAAEIVREKITRQLGDEVPYSVAVEVEKWSFENRTLHIHGLILVERDGQKRIVIGDKGSRLKSIGQAARQDMELLFDTKIMLNLWVKVKGGWADDERALRSLGYGDEDTF